MSMIRLEFAGEKMSKELTKRERKARIRKGLPIEALGLQFYPIRMTDYDEFLECKNALCIRQISLAKQSTDYLFMPFISALWAFDYDLAILTGNTMGLFERTIRFLLLSLRLESSNDNSIKCFVEQSNQRMLSHIEVIQTDGKSVKISPAEFTAVIRPLIADQNGLTLPDESENPELVEEEHYIAQEHEMKLKYDSDTLIASVALASCLREHEVDEWTITEFERRKQAIERDKLFMLYSQAEMSGMVKFKKGNPFPSWCLDKQDGVSSVLKSTSELKANFAALGDIEQAVTQTEN